MDRWLSVLKLELMSSEESAMEEDEEVIIVHPLPWRSARLNTVMRGIDDAVYKVKSPQARRQMKRHVIGASSARPKPCADNFPSWATSAMI